MGALFNHWFSEHFFGFSFILLLSSHAKSVAVSTHEDILEICHYFTKQTSPTDIM